MTTVEKIFDLITKSGKSEYTLKKEIGLPNSTFSEWRAGRAKPSADALTKIADYFDVSVDYLLGRVQNLPLPDGAYPVGETIKIPILGSVRAGIGGHLEEDINGYESIELMDLRGHNPKEFFWLKVAGDSMSPDIKEGDLVLVHKQNSVDSGDIAVIGIDNEEAVVKKVIYKLNENWLELHSFNPYYPPRRFEGEEELQRVIIIGIVKESKRKWN